MIVRKNHDGVIMKGVTCIIPAYNEEKYVGNVISAALRCNLIDEIILVDDGSKDNTVKIASSYDIKVIVNNTNRGKSYTVANGISHARYDTIMMLDADLQNLKPYHLTKLLLPVLKDQRVVALSLRMGNHFPWQKIGIDPLTGERVFHKSLVNISSIKRIRSYGLETVLNQKIIAQKRPLVIVKWLKVRGPLKIEKGSVMKSKGEFFMWVDIIKTNGGVIKFFKQVLELYRLKKINR